MKLISLVLLGFLSVIVGAQYIPDDSNQNPIPWHWCSSCPATTLLKAKPNGVRIIDLEVVQTSPLMFSAIGVRNAGTYEQTWWWYYNLDAAAVDAMVRRHNARIEHLEAYVVNSKLLFAVVLTPNTGRNEKTWWWYYDVTPLFLSSQVQRRNGRIVDIEAYTIGGVTKYAAVMIHNVGRDKRDWWWYTNASPSFIAGKLSMNKARLMDIERQPQTPDGTFTVVMDSSPARWRWYNGQTEAQLRKAAMVNKARLFHVAVDSNQTWAGIMISNA